jgi:hypothetical protein
VTLTLALWACTSPAPPPVLPPLAQETLALHLGESRHFDHIPATAALASLTVQRVVGGPVDIRLGELMVIWDDGRIEQWEDRLPVRACSRGYHFELHEVDDGGWIHARGPDSSCP